MAENKTQPARTDPAAFLEGVPNASRRRDGQALLALMQEVTGAPPVVWGPSMVGFGRYSYRYASGREGNALAVGFSPRSSALVLYGLTVAPEAAGLLERLGPHRTSVACLYVSSLAKVDMGVLEELIRVGYTHMTTTDFTVPPA
ncbi:MAG: hypothetical protein AVDCRST_MAG83-69 [uncultured Arthrobacter sp.]|uniref:YdhG-like domain-containing protein n=1 Tax=uncultured Arthrobacter sp. TaxID=114050 RepID=A0A6J4H3A1_9MICC|nr:DUF1801 domain-containing protein [uncultured Arthrobacter sp.]CAA9211330.1 MAG: hypothetical protein AVDCRST_MAG83-69 [uncultured Arthrobacter sp.]